MAAAILLVVMGAVLLLWLFGERWHPLRPSTLKFVRAGGRLHGYIYGRWTQQYINVLLNHLPTRGAAARKAMHSLAGHYHGKVLTQEQAEALLRSEKHVHRDLEQIIPYPTARDLVLHGPPEVAAYECVCRHARVQHCAPTQVCMVVGQPFVDFILEHNPHSSRRLSQAEALELLQQEHERGHVHSAWFKDAMLNRFYAICNCCKCCCGGIQTMTQWGVPMMASSGYVAKLNPELCNDCGVCVEACPFGALAAGDAIPAVTWDKCMGCGVCQSQCAFEAVELVRDERKGIPLDIRALC